MLALNKLYVVGIGPGAADQMTVRAMRALEKCDVIAGYGVYVELVKPLLPDKEYLVTPMHAGVYGMAGLIYELSEGKDVEIEVIPGVTAALSGGAVLGAPLTHDFAVISLSDLLTPWDKIEKRLECAAEADLCMAIYNPASHRRADYLRQACQIVLRHASPETVCGVVRNIGREGESMQVMTLKELADYPADMFTTVFIGNRQTKIIGGRMVTPRGYRDV